MNPIQLVIVASLFLAIAITQRIWTSDEPKFFKIAYTAIVFVPVIGPLAYLWLSNWPTSSPPHLRSNYRGQQLDAELERLYAGRRSRIAAGGREEAELNRKDELGAASRSSIISKIRHPSRAVFAVLLVLGAVFLAQFWLLTILFLRDAWPWVYANFWGASVGSMSILAILLVATPAYFWFAWQKWPNAE